MLSRPFGIGIEARFAALLASGLLALACGSSEGNPEAAGTLDSATSDGGSSPIDGGSRASEGGAKLAGTVRIMALGDSITGSTCWRARLWDKLTQNGHTNFKLVGSLNTSGDCSDPKYDGHNEGHGGYLVTDLVGTGKHASEPAQWFAANPSDIVLFHFGTNDAWNNIATAAILSAYTGVITELRKHSPSVIIVVAQVIPMNPTNSTCTNCACPQCGSRIQNLDSAIPGWASVNSTSASPIIVIDQWTGFDATADTRDGVHPNDSGSQKMAGRWYDALVQLF